jgi:hypothetical protein
MIEISYVESDIPEGMTLGEWRRKRCVATEPKRAWWPLVRRRRTVGGP